MCSQPSFYNLGSFMAKPRDPKKLVAPDTKKPEPTQAFPLSGDKKVLVKKSEVAFEEVFRPVYVWNDEETGLNLFELEPDSPTEDNNLSGCWGSGQNILGDDLDSARPEATLVSPLEVEGRSFAAESAPQIFVAFPAEPITFIVPPTPMNNSIVVDSMLGPTCLDNDVEMLPNDPEDGRELINAVMDDNIDVDRMFDDMLDDVDEVVTRELLNESPNVDAEDGGVAVDIKIEPASPAQVSDLDEPIRTRPQRRVRPRALSTFSEPDTNPAARRRRGRPPSTNIDLPPAGNSAQARYRRTRHLNNLASRRCRAKRKQTAEMEEKELADLEAWNAMLKRDEEKLELAIERMKNIILARVPNAARILKHRMV